MYQAHYAPDLKVLFIKIVQYEGAVLAQAILEAMRAMESGELESLIFIVADLRDLKTSSLKDSDRALQSLLFNQMLALRSDFRSIQLLRVLDPGNPTNPTVIERFNRINPVYGAVTGEAILVYSWAEAMEQIGVRHDYRVPYTP